jgi:hypothetical protein
MDIDNLFIANRLINCNLNQLSNDSFTDSNSDDIISFDIIEDNNDDNLNDDNLNDVIYSENDIDELNN